MKIHPSSPFDTTMANLLYVLLALVPLALSQSVCPPEGVGFVPDTDCTKYWTCDNGVAIGMECPDGLFFNPESKGCDFPDNVPECVGGTRPPIGTTVQTTTTWPTNATTTTQPTTTHPTTSVTTTQPTTTPPTTPVTTTRTTTRPTTTQAPDPGVMTKCGDTFSGSGGRIVYKLNEQYNENEYCSFIIRVPDNNGIVFKLHSHGFNGSADPNAINIFTFDETGQLDSAHLGPPNPLSEAYVYGAIAVVVFKTNDRRRPGEGLGTGFELSFEGTGNTAYSQGVELSFSDEGNITVPNWANYSGTTNILVFSGNHSIVGVGFDVLKLTISDEDFYTCGDSVTCGCDSLRVYSFLSDSAHEDGIFCNESIHKTVYQTRGILMVIFRKFWDGGWGKATLTWRVAKS